MKQPYSNKLDQLPAPEPQDSGTVAEQIYNWLYLAIVRGNLPPGTRLSETEIARHAGVSRQPVRETFRRLAQMDFLLIRPQRATVVAPISERRMRQAQFIRSALEIQIARAAANNITNEGLAEIADLINAQDSALKGGQRELFFSLDDQLHQKFCELSGHSYAWPVISDHKAHMDRMRYLSLNINSNEALSDHRQLLQALQDRDPDKAEDVMRFHLSRILCIAKQIREYADIPQDPSQVSSSFGSTRRK